MNMKILLLFLIESTKTFSIHQYRNNLERARRDISCPAEIFSCGTPLPYKTTKQFLCITNKNCPERHICCEDSCFSHKICKKERGLHCPRDSQHCSLPLNFEETKRFLCYNDECPDGYKCCEDSCFYHKICKKVFGDDKKPTTTTTAFLITIPTTAAFSTKPTNTPTTTVVSAAPTTTVTTPRTTTASTTSETIPSITPTTTTNSSTPTTTITTSTTTTASATISTTSETIPPISPRTTTISSVTDSFLNVTISPISNLTAYSNEELDYGNKNKNDDDNEESSITSTTRRYSFFKLFN